MFLAVSLKASRTNFSPSSKSPASKIRYSPTFTGVTGENMSGDRAEPQGSDATPAPPSLEESSEAEYKILNMKKELNVKASAVETSPGKTSRVKTYHSAKSTTAGAPVSGDRAEPQGSDAPPAPPSLGESPASENQIFNVEKEINAYKPYDAYAVFRRSLMDGSTALVAFYKTPEEKIIMFTEFWEWSYFSFYGSVVAALLSLFWFGILVSVKKCLGMMLGQQFPMPLQGVINDVP